MNIIRQTILITALALLVSPQLPCSAQNSTKKFRVKPNSIAAKVGSYVNWSRDLESAFIESNKSGKPVFWYVPTIRGTFMDRKTEVDRYMLAGFFSWPHLIKQLNENFICVKSAPTPQQQKQFELSRYKFVEPGFLIIADEKVIQKIDQITTQHPQWLQHKLAAANAVLGRNAKISDPQIDQWIEEFSKRLLTQRPAGKGAWPDKDELSFVYKTMFEGMRTFRLGQHETAKRTWQSLIDKYPTNPLAAKAAAEIQGIGPFTRGFEILTALPDSSFESGTKSRGTRAPMGMYTESEIWRLSTNFLLGMQNKNGGFFDSDYDFGGTDSLPNVHIAVSALAGMALIESAKRTSEDFRRAIINDAIDRCFDFVSDEKNLNRVDRDELLWAEAYRLRFLCARSRMRKDKDLSAVQLATLALQNIQSKRGGWYHEYQNSFVTATALTSLFDAKTTGASIDQLKIDAGINSLLSDRFSNGAYPYYSRPNQPDRTDDIAIQASAGRMPICELALARWGHSDQQRLKFAIEQSFKHHKKLAIALKYDNHTSTHAYGGFFFWYDMRSRTEAILALTDQQLKDRFLKQQHQLVMALPELDGCFVDSHELGRSYGTAMALLCLAGCSSSPSQ